MIVPAIGGNGQTFCENFDALEAVYSELAYVSEVPFTAVMPTPCVISNITRTYRSLAEGGGMREVATVDAGFTIVDLPNNDPRVLEDKFASPGTVAGFISDIAESVQDLSGGAFKADQCIVSGFSAQRSVHSTTTQTTTFTRPRPPGAAPGAPTPAPKKKGQLGGIPWYMFLCFPGEATVQLSSRGPMPLKDLSEGDEVLVESPSGELAYEPVLGFLHAVSGTASDGYRYLSVTHSHGELRISSSHIVFVTREGIGRSDKFASDLEVGDQLVTVSGASKVLAIHHDAGNDGMYAPLTSSGTVVVDGVIASNYAGPPLKGPLPHSCAHAVFAPVRMYNKLRSWTSSQIYDQNTEVAEVHKFVEVAMQGMKINVFHRLLSASQLALQ